MSETPERPEGVPAEATWSPNDNEWIVAPRDDEQREHGLVRYFRPDGTLCCETEHVHGTPHGMFKRFHETGDVSREGRFVEGTLEGTNVFLRCEGETSESFPRGLGPDVWRAEMDFEGGQIVGGRLYNRDGARVLEDGSPYPERPAGVPEAAHYQARSERWVEGTADDNGDRLGTWRWWSREGKLVETHDYVDGELSGKVVEHDEVDGELAAEFTYVEGEKHGPYAGRAALGEYRDERIVHERGHYEHDLATGEWVLSDARGTDIAVVDLGPRRDEETLARSPVFADEEKEPSHWLEAAKVLKTERRSGEHLAALARAVAAGENVGALRAALEDHCLPLSEQAAADGFERISDADDLAVLLTGLARGAAPAPTLRRLAILLDQRHISRAALDFVDAALALAPDAKEFLFTRSLVLMSLGYAEEAKSAAEALAEVEGAQGRFLLDYLAVLFPSFDFWPGKETPETYYEGLPDGPDQSLEAIRETIKRYAVRLLRVRKAMLERADETVPWMLPDISALLDGAGEPELREYRFEIEDPDDPDEPFVIDVDETLDPAGEEIPALLRLARNDWNAICWLCWACGLDQVALPDEIAPREGFDQAAGMSAQRLWRCRDKVHMGGRGAASQGIPGFQWEGLDIDELHPAVAQMAEAQYAEMQAMFYWLTNKEHQSPWQDNLRGS